VNAKNRAVTGEMPCTSGIDAAQNQLNLRAAWGTTSLAAIEPDNVAAGRQTSRRKVLRGVARFVLIRVAQAIPTLLLVAAVNFTLLNLAPGDLAQILAGDAGGAAPEYLQMLRHDFGLDQPLWLRLAHYLERIITLDLGYSFSNNETVVQLIVSRIPATLLLTGSALLLAIVVGILGGFVASLRPRGWLDRLISFLALILYATPNFLLGLALVILFSVKLRWLPAGGITDPVSTTRGLAHIFEFFSHLLLPASTLGLFFASIYVRLTRTAMLEVRNLEYVRAARARGLSQMQTSRRHVLRNALLPVVSVIGLQAGALLGGSILVEVVFSWPGLGRLAFEAVFQRDYNLLSGVVLVGAIAVIVMNIATDLLYTLLDPRIELQ
jgi:peptide/nickel transport system permease protein